MHLFNLVSKKKVESLAEDLLLGSGGMEFYQISGKVMVSVCQRIILLSFSLKKKKIQKNPMLILQWEVCPYDKLVKMKCSGLAFLEI